MNISARSLLLLSVAIGAFAGGPAGATEAAALPAGASEPAASPASTTPSAAAPAAPVASPSATPSAAATAPTHAVEPSASASGWLIERNERIDMALQRWASKDGWTIRWLARVTWESPSRADFQGDIVAAAAQVVEALNQDGKRLRLRVYESGRYMEVVSDAPN